MPRQEKILDPNAVIDTVRGLYSTSYTVSQKTRKSFGSIPPELHKKVRAVAEKNAASIPELIAGLIEFYLIYVTDNAEQLDLQREPVRKLLGTV